MNQADLAQMHDSPDRLLFAMTQANPHKTYYGPFFLIRPGTPSVKKDNRSLSVPPSAGLVPVYLTSVLGPKYWQNSY